MRPCVHRRRAGSFPGGQPRLGGLRLLPGRELEVLTKALDVSVGDEAGGKAEEGFVDVPTDAEAAEAVQPGDGSLDDPSANAEAGSMRDTTAGDHRFDALRPDQSSVLVLVVASIPEEDVGAPSRSSDQARDGRNLLEQRHQLGDVVAVSAGQQHRERDALPVDEDVVLAARPGAVDRAGPAFGPRRAARTWLESITARDQSSCLAARNFVSSTAWSRSHTPASFHAARRRQHVIPDPKPSSCGRYSHWMPVCSTNRIPHSACRSGTLGRPATSFGPGSGSNGSISAHSSSETIHGRDFLFPTTGPTSIQADSHTEIGFC